MVKDDSNETCTIINIQRRSFKRKCTNFVVLKVVETDPGVRGDTSGGGGKPAA